MSLPYRDAAPNPPVASPPARYASSLEAALPDDALWLDADGNVRPMPRRLASRSTYVAVLLSIGSFACVALAYGSKFGSGWQVFAVSIAVVYALLALVARTAALAARMISTAARGDDAQAVALADVLLRRRVRAAAFQRAAHLVKARAAVRAERYDDALEHYRAIRYAHGPKQRAGRMSLVNRVSEIAALEEITLLGNLARTKSAAHLAVEAASLLERALLAPSTARRGDYLTLWWDIARLTVAFAHDDPARVPDADVTAIATRYERLASAWGILALAGWHARRRADEALVVRAIAAELSKPRSRPLSHAMPALSAWLAAQPR